MKVARIETKTASTGNQYKTVYLDEQVNGKDRFNLFNNHTRFNDIVEGMELDATELSLDQKGYLNLADPDAGIKGRSGGSRTAQMERVMNQKNEMIGHAQDKKEEAIKLASSIRMAVDMVTAYSDWYKSEAENTEELKREIERWRSYFYTNWEKVTQDEPPF